MKKYLITILTLLIMLVGQSAGTAAAAGTVTLVGVSQTGHGAAFTFRVSGKFSKAKLKGSVHVENGGDYALHCTQVDEDTIKCKTSQKVSGANVSVTFGGSTFWTYVPASPDPTPEYCYDVWDWWDFTNNEWTDFGPHCQDAPANEGDIIFYTVPDPNGSFESFAEFYEEDVSDYCPSPVPYYGPAYYFPGCPEN
jgi:hypothetical protein